MAALTRFRTRWWPTFPLVLTMVALTAVGAGSMAQQATPVATPGPLLSARAAAIRAGDCANPGEIITPLTDLTLPRGPRLGQAPRTLLVQGSTTLVSLPLHDFLDHPALFEVRQTESATVLVCGEIGGPFDAVGTLHVGLREVAASGFAGIAHLTPQEDGRSTEVAVFITGEVARGQRRAAATAGGTGAAAGPEELGPLAATPTS